MYTSWPACHNQTTKFSKLSRQIQIVVFRGLINKALQALKETTHDFDEKIQNNQHPSIPRSFIQTIFSSDKWSDWPWFYNQHPVISSLKWKSFAGRSFLNRIILMPKITRMKSLMSSLKPSLMKHMKPNFL